MTHEEKINYMRIALACCSFNLKIEDVDLIVSIYDMIINKKGSGTIKDALEIENKVKAKYKTKI